MSMSDLTTRLFVDTNRNYSFFDAACGTSFARHGRILAGQELGPYMGFPASAGFAVGHREDIGRDAPRRALAIRPRSTHEKEEKGMKTTHLHACGGRLQ